MTDPVKLKRKLGLFLLTFYGLGNILGAGIYVLIGKVAGVTGYYAPFAFIMASLVAAITALTYAELSARMPLSAGEAVYLHRAFGIRHLSLLVGLLIAAAGMVSAATISRGFVGYLGEFIKLPEWAVLTGLTFVLGAVACWGIAQSVITAALITLLEISGLILVIWVAKDHLIQLPVQMPDLIPPMEPFIWQGIIAGAFLAFYAYIGFEDMVNVAEEVKAPQRNLPLAIILALIISSVLYLLVSIVAVIAVPPSQLASSDAPLALIYEISTGNKPVVITQIALFAVINGALIQVIMAARILYGMSREGWIPVFLGHVHHRTHTPVTATIIVTGIILTMALWLPLVTLARLTSFIVLVVFALVNLALWRLKHRDPVPAGIVTYPKWLPVLGFLTTGGLVGFEIFSLLSGNS